MATRSCNRLVFISACYFNDELTIMKQLVFLTSHNIVHLYYSNCIVNEACFKFPGSIWTTSSREGSLNK